MKGNFVRRRRIQMTIPFRIRRGCKIKRKLLPYYRPLFALAQSWCTAALPALSLLIPRGMLSFCYIWRERKRKTEKRKFLMKAALVACDFCQGVANYLEQWCGVEQTLQMCLIYIFHLGGKQVVEAAMKLHSRKCSQYDVCFLIQRPEWGFPG